MSKKTNINSSKETISETSEIKEENRNNEEFEQEIF